jgi:hypothetical protein
MDFKLKYGDAVLGNIEDAFVSDETWYGTFHISLLKGSTDIECRLIEFITFCKEWHKRLSTGQKHDASEFDLFNDILHSGLWVAAPVTPSDGTIHKIYEAPIFVDNEISWRNEVVERRQRGREDKGVRSQQSTIRVKC